MNKINLIAQDKIQAIFNEVKVLDRQLSKEEIKALKRYIEEHKGVKNPYVLFVISKTLKQKNIYHRDLLYIKLLLEYNTQYKEYDKHYLDSFNAIINSGYDNALRDIKEKECKSKLWLLLPLALKKVQAGYIYEDYINARIKYDTEQIYKQTLINIQQEKELNINNYEFKKIIDSQNRLNLNINAKKNESHFSGFAELLSTSIYHIGYIKACDDYNVKEAQFIAVIDNETTQVCKSMNMQVFKLYEENEYYRYNEEVEDVVLTKTKGLVNGINLPPITTTYHPCRSTIIAIRNLNKYVNNDIINPGYKIRSKNDNVESEINNIKEAYNTMPKKVKELLKDTAFEIVKENQTNLNYSRYDRNTNTVYIYDGADRSEVIHEIGHVVETKLNVYNNKKYINIRNEQLTEYSVFDIKNLKEYDVPGIQNDKFISNYQGMLYKKDFNQTPKILSNNRLNLNCLGEYFSEGFREYFENPINLKNKDLKLYQYIKGVVESE